MRRVEFDRHAKRRMKDRSISEMEALSTIETPDFAEPSVKGRTNAYKFIGGRYLRITYKLESNGIITVITAVARKNPFESGQHEN